MKKRKIVWFCAVQFTEEKIKTTGTWLIAMGNALAGSSDNQLYNVAYGDVQTITRKNVNNIVQWIIPHKERIKYHQGSKALVSFIRRVNDEIKPDLIHVWGTENGFGFAVLEAGLQTPVLMDMQGVLFASVKYYYGGLTSRDLWQCIGLKELLQPRNHPYFIRRKFRNRGKHELRLIQEMKNIAVQSEWVHTIVKYVNPGSNIFHTGIMLRNEFLETSAWSPQKIRDSIIIFTSCSGPIPYKGLHLLFEAVAILKKKYPNIQLSIGGDIQIEKKYGLIREGYTTWMLQQIERLGIKDAVRWLGMMTADEMIAEMHQSTMVVIPSFVESYCMFLAESMMVGVPAVVSYAGAMPQLAVDNQSALFFPSGDHWSCARQIERIITDCSLAGRLSAEARKEALLRNNPEMVLQTQLNIYDQIVGRL